MPIPPLTEMQEIVRLVRELREAMTDVDEVPRMVVGDAAKLRQSILKAAFEGRLVAQDPGDEPAERLLARVSNDAGSPPPSRRRGRPAKQAEAAS